MNAEELLAADPILARTQEQMGISLRSLDECLAAFLGLIESVCCNLTIAQATTLQIAAQRSLEAFNQLHAFLASQPPHSPGISGVQGTDAPVLSAADARRLNTELNRIMMLTEANILSPLEQLLPATEQERLKHLVGQLWGWIVCDLQTPIWKIYPELAP